MRQMESYEQEEASQGSEESDPSQKKPKGPKFWVILTTAAQSDHTVEPQHYLAAIAELLALTIAISFVMTWMYQGIASHCYGDGSTLGTFCPMPFLEASYFEAAKDRLSNNPIKNMVGYNNPCAFWDQPPSLYFAGLMFLPMVYFAFRYAINDTMRAHLVMQKNAEDFDEDNDSLSNYSRSCLLINWTYAASQCIVMGIFVVTPHVSGDMWPTCNPNPPSTCHTDEEVKAFNDQVKLMHWKMRAHSACFLQLVPILCLTMSANYFEAHLSGIPLTKIQWAVLAFYIIATIMETIFATTAIFGYQGDYSQHGNWQDNFVFPKFLMQCIDYAWFLSLPLASHFQPVSPDIRIATTLAEDDEAKTGDDTEAINFQGGGFQGGGFQGGGFQGGGYQGGGYQGGGYPAGGYPAGGYPAGAYQGAGYQG